MSSRHDTSREPRCGHWWEQSLVFGHNCTRPHGHDDWKGHACWCGARTLDGNTGPAGPCAQHTEREGNTR